MAAVAPLAMRPVMFQDLSLPGQPRDSSASLGSILRDEGITRGGRIGVVGWKTYSTRDLIEARLGLLSPGDRRIERGDPFTIAFGIWGALNCRAGFVVEDAGELAEGTHDYVARLVAPYFEAVADWYRALHVGQTGGELHRIVERHLGDPFFGVRLNPGHQLHLDEWVNSPVFPGSRVELRSGMALQCDIIPATGTPYFTTNVEDGVAVADATLRADLAAACPGAWDRIQARRRFMADVLGIELHPDVLPLSNLAGYLPPFLLRPDRAMTAG